MRSLIQFLLAAALGTSPFQAPAQAPLTQVILVTIDGLRGDYYWRDDLYHLKIPNLRSLMERGSYSERTFSVFPTLTNTAHTSIVTGLNPGRHGVLGNNQFQPETWDPSRDNYDAQEPYRDLKVRALWDAAREKGLKTAAVFWPLTSPSAVHYVVSGGRGNTAEERRQDLLKNSTPSVIERIERSYGTMGSSDARLSDHFKAIAAADIIRNDKPNLTLVHFSFTDNQQHTYGPGTLQALAAMEDVDQNIGVLIQAVRAAALEERTVFIITGDHGFLRMHSQIGINIPLYKAGLIEPAPKGVTWQAIVNPNRSFGAVYLKNSSLRERVLDIFKRMQQEYPGRFEILSREELDRLGADRNAAFGLESIEGYVFDGRLDGDFIIPHNRAAGHGYRPSRPGMETGFIIAGPGIRHGVRLPVTQTIDIAPTVARLLGLEMSGIDGKPIVGVLR